MWEQRKSMRFATATSLFGGTLFTLTTLAAAPASPKLDRLGNPPAVILAENIRTASPATTHYTAQNGYTGELTLLASRPGQARPQPTPLNKVPDEMLRFDKRLPASTVVLPLLDATLGKRDGVIRYAPTPAHKQ
jgi:hypothetical protein